MDRQQREDARYFFYHRLLAPHRQRRSQAHMSMKRGIRNCGCRLLAFLDILGFSHAIQTTHASADSQRLVGKIVAAIADSREYVRRDLAEDAKGSGHWALKFFSDNLVIGYPLEATVSPAAAFNSSFGACNVISSDGVERLDFSATLDSGIHLSHGRPSFLAPALVGLSTRNQGLDCSAGDPGESLRSWLQSHGKIRWRRCIAPLEARSAATSMASGSSVTSKRPAMGRRSIGSVDGHKRAILESLAGTTRHDVLPKYG